MNNSAPKVSVIVPNYNHARFLNQRIDTILNQTFQDFELILLDDCSTDHSRSILSSYASDPRVRLEFNEANSGTPFKQWNKGVSLSRGEYIWIAESDDYADPRILERLVSILDAKSQIAYVNCRSWCVSETGELTGYVDDYLASHVDPRRWTADYCANGREECRKYFARTNIVANASAVVFRRAAYQQVGGADENLRLCGDWKLWAAMALTGEVAYLSQPLNYFRSHNGSVRSKTQAAHANLAENLQVIAWILHQVKPSDRIINKIYKWQTRVWVPALMSTHVPFQAKRAILRAAREMDPHPLRHALRPALSIIRLKLLRHWRQVTTHVSWARELWAWWRCRTPDFPTVDKLNNSMTNLSAYTARVSAAAPDPEAPIFLLATGIRTGSTLLQRILVTDSRLLLWGEPLGEMAVVPRIARMLSDSLSPSFLRSWQTQPSPDSPELAKIWIAHLHPDMRDFRSSLRNMFDTWLAQPARKHGFARWGFKEVRLDATDAVLLHWLYPNAKFILLTRHPYRSYASFADYGSTDSFVQHPALRVNSAASFATEWNRIAASWADLPEGFPAFQLKYEDLISGTFDFRSFESWLGLELKENDALSEVVGHSASRDRLRWYERWIVSRQAVEGMRFLGYSSRPIAVPKPIPIQSAECVVTDQKSA